MNRVVLLLTCLLAASTAIAADTPQKKKKLGNAHAAVKPWKPTPFVLESERLPTGYIGLDPKKFLKMFESKIKSMKKGEFETSEELARRIANKDAVLAPINTSDLYAFRIGNINIKYDADTQAYIIGERSFGYQCKETLKKDWITCKVASISREHDTYDGSNAYGALIKIERERGYDFGLAFSKDSPLFNSVLLKGEGSYIYQAPYNYQDKVLVTLEKARNLKNLTVAILFVGRVSDAKMVENPTLLEPTFDSPYDTFIMQEAIPFELKKIIYYVIQTGEILGQKDF